jgi:hypothetical protein
MATFSSPISWKSIALNGLSFLKEGSSDYPENPKRASLSERRSIYDSLLALQDSGNGSVSMRVEAPLGLGRTIGRRTELTSCSLFVALPLSAEFSTR